jgi:hypothetical protein
MTELNTWNNIPIKQPKSISRIKHYNVIEIAKWAYIVDQERFVIIDDPYKQAKRARQFNVSFPEIKLPAGKTPERYIMNDHAATRIFDRMKLMPDKKEKVVFDGDGLKILNTFKQPPKPPANINVSQEKALDFFRYFFRDDLKAMDHTLKWMTHYLFVTKQKIEHGLMLSSGQGTGKGTMATILQKLSGEPKNHVNPSHMKGDHQSWMLNKRLIRIEELKEYNDPNFYNRLKTYFTEPTYTVNLKYRDPFEYDNISCFFIASNYINPLALDADDRRFFYYHSNATKRPIEYWEDLRKYLFDEGGIWAFRNYLEKKYLPRLDLAKFPYEPPYQTQAHKTACLLSQGRLIEVIESQRLDRSGLYEQNKFFLLEDFKQGLAEENGLPILRNNNETNSQLMQAGLQIKEFRSIRIFGDNNRRMVAWWDYSDIYLRSLFNEPTTKINREKLYASYYGLKSYKESSNPFLPEEDNQLDLFDDYLAREETNAIGFTS